jgi:uncharacterized lipoprotein YajG
MHTSIRKILAASLFLLAGCAPGLGREIPVGPIVAEEEVAAQKMDGAIVSVQMRPFVDQRPTRAIALIDGREVNSSGDLAVQVRDALEQEFKKSGISIGNPNAPIVGGQITAWSIKIDPGFPASTAQADATLSVEVSDLNNQIVFRGKYSGTTLVKHPLLNEEKISAALGQAMGYAVQQVVHDEKFLEVLTRTLHPIS